MTALELAREFMLRDPNRNIYYSENLYAGFGDEIIINMFLTETKIKEFAYFIVENLEKEKK